MILPTMKQWGEPDPIKRHGIELPPAYKFAENYPVHEYPDGTVTDWIKFPQDNKWRREWFVEESLHHPAKANLYMVQELTWHLTTPGQLILDPFGGVGSQIIVATDSRRVVLFELSAHFVDLIKANTNKLGGLFPELEVGERVIVMQGDCRQTLPMFQGVIDAIITSPPYAQALQLSASTEAARHVAGYYTDTFKHYVEEGSLGMLPKFRYNMEMSKVYALCYDALKPGGVMATIVKDYMLQGERVQLSRWVITTCRRNGFVLLQWFKRHSPGTGYLRLHKSQGREVVEDEDIIVLGKPKEGYSG